MPSKRLSRATELLGTIEEFLQEAAVVNKARFLRRTLPKLQRVFTVVFRKQWAAYGAELQRQAERFHEAESWLNYINWDAILETALTVGIVDALDELDALVILALRMGADKLFAEQLMMGLTFNLANPRALAYMRAHGAQLITGINQTTRKQIKAVLERGMSEGWSYDKLARELKGRWAEFAVGKPQLHIQSRAHLIAVTEIGEAYEEGSYQAALQLEELGIVMEHSWLTVGDDRVSEGCAENEAVGWIPLAQPFPSGHLHPLRFPGCRCTELTQRVRSEGE